MYNDEWQLDLRADHFVMYTTLGLLCCTPDTNIMLYTNFTSKKKKKELTLLVGLGNIVEIFLPLTEA